MTIKERFSKYTASELEESVARLSEKVANARELLEAIKVEGNSEFYEMAERNYREYSDILLDVWCALKDRQKEIRF